MRANLRNLSIALLVAGFAYAVAAVVMFAVIPGSDMSERLSFNAPTAMVTGSAAATLYGICFVVTAIFLNADGVIGLLALRRERTDAFAPITLFQVIGWIAMILLFVLVILNLLAASTLWLLVFLATAGLFGGSGHVAQRVKQEIRAEEGRRYKGGGRR